MSKVDIEVFAGGATSSITFSGEGAVQIEESGQLVEVTFYPEPGKPKLAGYVRTEAVVYITVEQDD